MIPLLRFFGQIGNGRQAVGNTFEGIVCKAHSTISGYLQSESEGSILLYVCGCIYVSMYNINLYTYISGSIAVYVVIYPMYANIGVHLCVYILCLYIVHL